MNSSKCEHTVHTKCTPVSCSCSVCGIMYSMYVYVCTVCICMYSMYMHVQYVYGSVCMFDVLQLCIILQGCILYLVMDGSSPHAVWTSYSTFNGELYSCLCCRLSLDVTGFNQQATGAVLDLTADDDEGLAKNKGRKKWWSLAVCHLMDHSPNTDWCNDLFLVTGTEKGRSLWVSQEIPNPKRLKLKRERGSVHHTRQMCIRRAATDGHCLLENADVWFI